MGSRTYTIERAEELLARRELRLALAAFDRAEAAGAEPARCAGGRWHCYMLLGQYERAWCESDAIRSSGAPDEHRVWDGTPLRGGERVLVRSVHGYGDAVQMLRFAPRLGAGCVTVQAAPAVCDLLRMLPGVDRVVPWGEEPEYDVQLEVNELAYLVRAAVTDLCQGVPYLKVSPTQLGRKRLPRVGLVWTGSSWNPARSLPFACLQPLLDAGEGVVDFWSLQAEENNGDWRERAAARGSACLTAGEHSPLALAEAIAAMDSIITVDTFAAHLAGAMGKPVAVLLEREADWRWMVKGENSPWYPSMRLLRQVHGGDWSAPLEGVVAMVRGMV